MNTWILAVIPPGRRRVLACTLVWLALGPPSLAVADCLPVLPSPLDILEVEPNNGLPMAQAWPILHSLVGSQSTVGDPDYLALEGLPPQASFQLSVTPDTFNPRLRLWGQSGGLWQLLVDQDQAGWCQAEQVTVNGWDPCQLLVPVDRYVLQVTQSSTGAPQSGNYRAAVVLTGSSEPPGDCCQYPIAVPNGLTYTDNQNTGTAFRDMGFGPSPDVWYQLVLDQSSVLTAQTCGGQTNFDTVLRVVDDDCQTVLALNDNSLRCAPSLVESWLSLSLQAGTYYVVVEGSGTASGLYTLNLRLASCPGVVPGPGALHELEPNDEVWQAQRWPVEAQLYGEQGLGGDEDYFRLLLPDLQGGFELSIQPDSFDPYVRVYAETSLGLQLVAEANNGGTCEAEQVSVAGWDPCQQLVPIQGWIVGVSQSPAGGIQSGHYLGSALLVSSNVPPGDCCQYPIAVPNGLTYTDNQNTGVAFRDMGFGPSPDVWYQLVLDQSSVLTAQTCGGQTNFDTVLRVVDDDCQTVLAANDNSLRCATSLVESWLSLSLQAGTYYVVVEGSGTASGLYTLNLRLASCPGVVPGPGALHELEPNDEVWQAQLWPVEAQLYGEQGLGGDSDFFLLGGILPSDGVSVQLQPDSFDPILRLYSLSGGEPTLLAESNETGFCEVESVNVSGWDPCLQLVPVEGLLLEVCQAGTGLPQSGHYLASALVVSSGVPAGDCCQVPLNVGAFPYTDNQDTGTAFRDMGFGPSPDVWYRIDLESAGVLTAQTCGGQSNFDTILWVVDDDCQTVLASNDNSAAGCGAGSQQSWLVTCLTAGSYYVVVEGSGTASGLYTLNLALRPNGAGAHLQVGDWGWLAEEWHNHFQPESAILRVLDDDPCGGVAAVHFYGQRLAGPRLYLGSDLDGWEPPLATLPDFLPDGDGWSLPFNPSWLGPEAGPVRFEAELVHEEGDIQLLSLDSWYAPNLSLPSLFEPLADWEVVHAPTITLRPAAGLLPGTRVAVATGVKSLNWSRAVPFESQRGVSDTHCAPTAAAACLEWLDATYGSNVCGGLSGEALTRALGEFMSTNVGRNGTRISDMNNGLQHWINHHGGGYTVHTQKPATTAGMQKQGEAQGQDVIAVLRWAGSGAHAVTLSSVHNLPNPDGTVSLDFMDPWTGSTQWGNFNPSTGAFSGYGDGGSSGTLGQATYVCPTQGGPGASRLDWQAFEAPLEIALPDTLSWVKLYFLDIHGRQTEAFVIVEERAAVQPQVEIELLAGGEQVRLAWLPVPEAQAYRIYRSLDGYVPIQDLEPWLETEHCWALDSVLPGESRWFYQVVTVYPQ